MADFEFQPSAGMLWPEKVSLSLAGRSFVVEELRVRDVGAIESAFATLMGDPFEGLERERDIVRNRSKYTRRELIDAALTLHERSASWPLRMGSADFSDIQGTMEGCAAFLWVVLSRNNPGLEPPEVMGLIEGAGRGEVFAIERAAWGYAPWEGTEAAKDRKEGRESPETLVGGGAVHGTPWGKHASFLARTCGYTYEEIGDLYISQFLNEIRAGNDILTSLPEPEDAP